MRFPKGQSGNPEGRPKGSKNKATQLREALYDDLPSLLQVVKKAAMSGDMTAARLLLERTVPACKPSTNHIELPELAEAMTLAEKAKAIITAIGQGTVAPEAALSVIAAISQTAKIIEVSELEARIDALERSTATETE